MKARECVRCGEEIKKAEKYKLMRFGSTGWKPVCMTCFRRRLGKQIEIDNKLLHKVAMDMRSEKK